MMQTFLEKPLARQWGWVVLALFAGFAAGNYHATDDAVKGSARWWQGQVHKDLKAHLTDQQQKDYNVCVDEMSQFEKDAGN